MAKKTTTTTKKKTTTTSKKTTSSARKTTPSTTTRDAEQNKGMAIIAYILFFVPLLTGDHKKSPFVKFHTNQGTVLFLTWIAWWLVSLIVSFILRGWFLGLIFSLVGFAVWVGVIVLLVLGIINAVNGRMNPLPLIGKFTIIK
jgi:uncharacterized membrane protein